MKKQVDASSYTTSRGTTAILAPPVVESRVADPVLAAQIRRAHARLMLLQNANDLRFAEP